MSRSKLLLVGLVVVVGIALAVGWGVWRRHQAELAQQAAAAEQQRQTEAAWNQLQAAENARLAAELDASLNLARSRLAEVDTEKRRLVTLSVITSPAGASLQVARPDTERQLAESSTPFSRGLPKGQYRLSLRLAGYEIHEETIDLTAANQSLRIDLRPLPPPEPKPARPAAAHPVFSDDFPKQGVNYTVQPGDTLATIAGANRARLQDIINANRIADPTGLRVGQVLFIPQASSPPIPATKPEVKLPQPPAVRPDSYTNSLGMKFARLPGSIIHVSAWLTREQDYAVFVRETSRGWSNAASGATHPAVNVSWQDARAFCAWLTARERAAGRITAQQTYRLPTDAEWSRAAGLPSEAGNSPKAKDGGIADVFPWGRQWPPPTGAGNYGPSLAVDNFARTSPVDTFPANAAGLHDMGGNVWQWCEDEYDPAAPGTKVLRGASFSRYARGYLLSSFRHFDRPDTRDVYTGFRCVLLSNPE